LEDRNKHGSNKLRCFKSVTEIYYGESYFRPNNVIDTEPRAILCGAINAVKNRIYHGSH